MGSASIKVKIVDKIDYARMAKVVGADRILIGYPEGEPHQDTSYDMAGLARLLSYDGENRVGRPFLEEGIYSQRDGLTDLVASLFKARVEGQALSSRLKRIAVFAIKAVQEFVRGDYYKNTVPNAQSTIDRKSRRQKGQYLLSDIPLIDSSNMINALTSVTKSGK